MEIILNKLGHLPTEFFYLKSRNWRICSYNADKDINVSKLLNLQ
jgi:hypothetical protein